MNVAGTAPGAQYTAFKVDKETGTVQANLQAGGVDIGAMLDAVEAATEARKERPTQQLEISSHKKEALATTQLAAMDLESALKDLQGKSLLDHKRGIFGILSSRYQTINGSEGSEFIHVTADRTAEPRSADISVIKLAEQDSIKAAAKFSDSSTASALSGTLTFKNITPEADDIIITLDGTQSPAHIVSLVNAYQEATGVRASLIPSGTEFVMTFDSLQYSTPIAFEADMTAGNTLLLPQSRTTNMGTEEVTDDLVALGIIGSLTFAHTDGVSPDITVILEGTESASDILTLINNETGDTGVSASLAGDPGSQQLVFTTTDNISPLSFTKNITGGEENYIPDPSTVTTETLKSIIEFEGERSSHLSNQVQMPDMTVELIQPTQAEGADPVAIKVHLENLKAHIGDTMQTFVDQMTSTLRLIEIFTAVDPESITLNATESEQFKDQIGVLRGDAALTSLDNFVKGLFITSVDGKTVANMGLTLESGVPQFNLTEFYKAYDDNPKAVERHFTFSETSTDPLLSTTAHPDTVPQSLKGVELTVEINRDGSGVYTASITYPGNVGSPITFEVNDNEDQFLTLKADSNSVFAGFEFFYDKALENNDSVNATMTIHQGLADMGLGFLKTALGETGTFALQTKSIDEQAGLLEEKLEKIDKRGEKEIQRMRVDMERAMIRAQMLEQMVKQIQMMEMMTYAAAA